MRASRRRRGILGAALRHHQPAFGPGRPGSVAGAAAWPSGGRPRAEPRLGCRPRRGRHSDLRRSGTDHDGVAARRRRQSDASHRRPPDRHPPRPSLTRRPGRRPPPRAMFPSRIRPARLVALIDCPSCAVIPSAEKKRWTGVDGDRAGASAVQQARMDESRAARAASEIAPEPSPERSQPDLVGATGRRPLPRHARLLSGVRLSGRVDPARQMRWYRGLARPHVRGRAFAVPLSTRL